jgi:hypothetical protein
VTDERTHDLILSKEHIETWGVSLQFVKFTIVILVPSVHAFTCLLLVLTHLSCHDVENCIVNHESLQVLTFLEPDSVANYSFSGIRYDREYKNKK